MAGDSGVFQGVTLQQFVQFLPEIDVLDQFLEDWHKITQNSTQEIAIDDENAYPIKGFKFVVSNNGKLNVKTTIIDEIGNDYSIDLLTY